MQIFLVKTEACCIFAEKSKKQNNIGKPQTLIKEIKDHIDPQKQL